MRRSPFALLLLVLSIGVASPSATAFAQGALGAGRGGSHGGGHGGGGGGRGHSGGSAGSAGRGGFGGGGGGSSGGGGFRGGGGPRRQYGGGYGGGYGYYPYYGGAGAVAVGAAGPPPPLTSTYFRMTFAGGFGRWAEPAPDGGLVVTGPTADLGLSIGRVIRPRLALHVDADFGVLMGNRGRVAGGGWEDYTGLLTHSLLGAGLTVNPRDQGLFFTAAIGTGMTRVSTAGGNGHSRFGIAGYAGFGYLCGTRPNSNLRFSILARMYYLNASDDSRVSNFSPQIALGISH